METFDLPFVQRGVLEILLLSAGAGIMGTWIVLRGLSFFTHAVGTAAFPGLVLADGLGFAPLAGAFGAAFVVAALVGVLSRRQRDAYDSLTALVLIGALALGVVLASDVFGSGAQVDRLLFGSLLVIGTTDLILAGMAALCACVGAALLGRRWLAIGFDEGAARAQGVRGGWADAVLLALVALLAVASLSAIGALLTTALLVVPAATTRLSVSRMGTWQVATVVLAAVEGVAGLWLSVRLNAPPGATIAVLSGVVFALAAIARAPTVRRAVAGLTAAALLALGVSGCGAADGGSSSGSSAGSRLEVVASTTQLADFARRVGGDRVDVHQILQPSSDPHEYEPRPADVLAVANARLVLLSGFELDRWMEDVVKQSGTEALTVTVGDHAPVRRNGAGEDVDPHWWQDPRNVMVAIPVIRDAMRRVDTPAAGTFAANAATYLRRLASVESGIQACLAKVPPSERKLVTDHDALGYFADRYAIRVVGAVIPSPTTQAQPSAGELAKLAQVIRAEHVKAIFPESSVNPKLARAIAERTGATAELTLYADTLGPAGSAGATYLGALAANADAMVRGFTGGRERCPIRG
jgi:zinc/manganese transport system substrate-binding protein